MKKNLAKRIVLGLLTGAVLMSSSVAWAGYSVYTFTDNNNTIENSFGVGCDGENNDTITPGNITSSATNSIVIGIDSHISSEKSVALGNDAEVSGSNSVALGYGSVADAPNVVSVGSGVVSDAYATRKIVNVTKGELDTDAVNVGQLQEVKDIVGTGKVRDNDNKIDGVEVKNFNFTNGNNLTETLQNMAKTLDPVVQKVYNDFYTKGDVYTKTEADAKFVKIGENNVINNSITINENSSENPVTIGSEGITVGTNSARIDGSGFYVWGQGDTSSHNKDKAIASMTEDGKIKGAGGKFEVDTEGKVTASSYIIKDSNGNKTNIKTALDSKANAADVYTKDQADGLLDAKANKADVYDKTEIDTLLSNNNADAISGINQRLEKTNAKINKVGAGAAALAALHPLDYDPDDKLTFSAGMGNYAGENAAALGAFYRPNEKFMLSLGGTMGNGENMVNLGLSIGLDKPNGLAKLSKRELIQKVNAVEAENDALEDRVAKLEALVAQLASK